MQSCPPPFNAPIRVAVFAHNEAKTIGNTLDQLFKEVGPEVDFEVHVLNNGSTDRTEQVVNQYAAPHEGLVVLHNYELGDKAATWNKYAYEVSLHAPKDSIHFFMDGDVWPEPGSLAKMSRALINLPDVSVISGLPMSGRNRDRYCKLALEKHLLYANIYATRNAWLDWARQVQFRIPQGLIGDDWVLVNAFATLPDNLRKASLQRIHHLPDCGYRFRPLRPWHYHDMRLYVRRLIRHRLARKQMEVMGWLWPDQMPENADSLDRAVLADLSESPRRLNLIDRLLRKHLEGRYGISAA